MSANTSPKPSPLLSAFSRLTRRLRGVASSILGSEADAEDALQDAFVRLWPQHDKIATEAEAEGKLTLTVRHLSIDRLRRRQTTHMEPLDEELDVPPDEEANEAEERERRFRQVQSIIERELSPVAREILHRHEYEGQDFDTIAAALDMQPAAVRMQLSRARKTIRMCYLKLQEE